MGCIVCGRDEPLETTLCSSCIQKLDTPQSMCAEQVYSVSSEQCQCSLIDGWGRIHNIPNVATIGRELDENDIIVLHKSVSRQHAQIVKKRDDWYVQDLKSTNGTFADQEKVLKTQRIEFDSVVKFGEVAFFFTEKKNAENPPRDSQLGRTAPSSLFGPDKRLELFGPKGSGGGIVRIDEDLITLSTSQFELVLVLAQRLSQDKNEPMAIRGFIRSAELIYEISWDTAHPSDDNVKQLIRRIRQSFARAGYENIIESRQGMGYRLKLPE